MSLRGRLRRSGSPAGRVRPVLIRERRRRVGKKWPVPSGRAVVNHFGVSGLQAFTSRVTRLVRDARL